MKKLLSVFLACLMVCSVLPMAMAETEGDFTYEVWDDMVYVDGYTGTATEVTIPDTLGGLPVTVVDSYCFENNETITKVTVPENVVDIYGFAFQNCSNLTTVNLPASLEYVSEYVFSGCPKLTTITLPEENEYFSVIDGVLYCLYYDYEADVMVSGELVCYPAGKTETSYTLPETVTSIYDGAFDSTANLKEITLHDNVKSLTVSKFNNSGIYENEKYWTSGGFIIGNYFIQLPADYEGKFTVPAGVKQLAESSFAYCENLTQVELPDSLEIICDYAFWCCTALEKLHIPANVESIVDDALYRLSSLTAYTVDANNPYFAAKDGILYNKTMTELVKVPGAMTGELEVPAGVTRIGYSAVEYCEQLENVVLPDSVTEIDDFAFAHCTSLTEMVLPDNITRIDNSVFNNCTSLSKITMPKYLESIGYDSFADTALTQVTLPATVIYLNEPGIGLHYDDELGYITDEDFVLNGYSGSIVEEYANEYGIQFNSLGSVYHQYSNVTNTDVDDYTIPFVRVAVDKDDAIYGCDVIVTQDDDEDDMVNFTISFQKDGQEVTPSKPVMVQIETFIDETNLHSVEVTTDDGTTSLPLTVGSDSIMFTIQEGGSFVFTETYINLGDINKDTKIDAGDALMVLKAAVGKIALTEAQEYLGEVDGNNKLDAGDALEILKYAVGKIDIFPIEESMGQ